MKTRCILSDCKTFKINMENTKLVMVTNIYWTFLTEILVQHFESDEGMRLS
jgi:hypothetical protein